MGSNGKKPRRWRISFFRSPKRERDRDRDPPPPPQEFLCPISKSLMSDPTIVSSGHSFDRLSIQVCLDLNLTPSLPDSSTPNFSSLIPNLALKSAILNWCSLSGSDPPTPPSYSHIQSILHSQITSQNEPSISERELLKGVSEAPQVLFSHASSDKNFYSKYSSCSTSSEESVIANATPLLPFATRPSCLSFTSSPSTSSEFIPDDPCSNASTSSMNSSSSVSSEAEENLFGKMKSLDVYEQEQAIILLRKTTRMKEESRSGLCTERVLLALKPLLKSRYDAVQINAAAAVVNLSLERVNKVKIVRAGVVPLLIDLLKNGFDESKEHAAGALFSLALEDENKTVIGVLGALQPLLHELRAGSKRSRQDAALALYHLTLVRSNRAKIMRLGAVGVLLGLLKDKEVAPRVVLVVCNLAACEEGRAALLDANAVECLVGVLRNGGELGSESTRENCVAALYSLSHGSLRFRGLAKDAGAVEVLTEVMEKGSERAKEKARRILEGLKGPEEAEDGEEVDWEAVMEGGVTRARKYRVGKSHRGRNSTEF